MTFHELKVFDFHAHFPTEKWANWMVSFQRRLAEKYGERNAKILMEQSRRGREGMRKLLKSLEKRVRDTLLS